MNIQDTPFFPAIDGPDDLRDVTMHPCQEGLAIARPAQSIALGKGVSIEIRDWNKGFFGLAQGFSHRPQEASSTRAVYETQEIDH
jgi:hypothetical protein